MTEKLHLYHFTFSKTFNTDFDGIMIVSFELCLMDCYVNIAIKHCLKQLFCIKKYRSLVVAILNNY